MVTDPDKRAKLLGRGIDPDLAEEIGPATQVDPIQQNPTVTETPSVVQPKPRGLLGKAWDVANYPFIKPEAMRKGLFGVAPALTGQPSVQQTEEFLGTNAPASLRVVGEAEKGIANVASGVVTPLGIATMGVAPGLKALQFAPKTISNVGRALAGAFAVPAAKHVVEAVPQVIERAKGPDPISAISPAIEAGGSALIAGLAGKHALTKPNIPASPFKGLRERHMVSEPLVPFREGGIEVRPKPSMEPTYSEPTSLAIQTGAADIGKPTTKPLSAAEIKRDVKTFSTGPDITESGAAVRLESEVKAKQAEAAQIAKLAKAESESVKQSERLAAAYKEGDKATASYFKMSAGDFEKLPIEAKGELRNRQKSEIKQKQLESQYESESMISKPTIAESPVPIERVVPFEKERLESETPPAKLKEREGIYSEEPLRQQGPDDLIRDRALLEKNYLNALDEMTKVEKSFGRRSPEFIAALDKAKAYGDKLNLKINEPESRNQEGPSLQEVKTERQKPIVEVAKEQGVPLEITKAWDESFKALGVQRNVKIDSSGRVFKNDGTEVSGEVFVREGLNEALAKINLHKGGLDTYPHELFHRFFDDMKNFGTSSEKALTSRALSVLKSSSDYVQWKSAREKGKLNSTPEEYLTTLVGEDTVRRALRLDKKGSFRNWMDDFWSHVKSKVGKATDADIARIMSRKLSQDLPFEQTFGKKGGGVTNAKEEIQKEQEILSVKGTQLSEEGMQQPSSEIKPISKVESPIEEMKRVVDETPEAKVTPVEPKPGVGKRVVEDAQRRGVQYSEGEPLRMLKEEDIELSKSSPVPSNELPVERQPFELYIPKLRAEIDKIKAIGSEAASKISSSFTDFYDQLTTNRGRYLNKFNREIRNLVDLDKLIHNLKSPKEYLTQDTPELKRVVEYFDNIADGKEQTITLTPNETKIVNVWKKFSKEIRDEQNARSGLRKGGHDEDYFPQTPARAVIRELQQNPDSPKSKQLMEDFLEYKDNDQQKLDIFLKGHSKEAVNIAKQFGPIDKAEGIGIPRSWREPVFTERVNRYLDRISRRFAYYDKIENTSYAEVLKLRGNQEVKNVYNDIIGVQPVEEAFRSSLMGIVRAGMLGLRTGTVDFASNLHLGFQHAQNPVQAIQASLSAWANMKKNIADSFETGRNRINLNALEWDRGSGDIINILKRTRDVISEVQGRNWLEQMTRATAMGQGRFYTLDFGSQAAKGSLSSAGRKFFKDFAKDISEADYGKLTPEQVKTISAHYVDSVQGTYDYRGLPQIAIEGTFSPILSLARWNIEKANNYMKYVATPLINGNPRPFLMSTLGAVLGGAAITKIVEELTGKKEKTPKVSEIIEAKEKGKDITMPVLYKATGLASMAGYGGMLGDLSRNIMDVVYGKNKPQWYNNVLLEFLDNSTTTLMSLYKTINEEGYSHELILDATAQVLEDNLQSYRIILSHASAEKKEDIEKANKFRDLRIFNLLEGNGITDNSMREFDKPIGDKTMREFKETDDIGEAVQLLPELLLDAVERSEGDPERLIRRLEKIKRNSYQTMPSPTRMAPTFVRYITFLEKTQGPEAARDRLLDYIKQNEVNKAKTEMLTD